MAAAAAVIIKKKREAEAAAKAAEDAEQTASASFNDFPVAIDELEIVQPTADEDGQASDETIVHELYLRVKDSLESKANYCNLAAFFVFVAMYMGVLYLQMDAWHTYQVASAHKALLPPDTFLFGGGVPDIYSWLNDTIINTIYVDAVCGDGVCSSVEEYPGFGNFGCQADCGYSARVTNVTVVFTPFDSLDDMSVSDWNLCMTSPAQFCWFPENQKFGPLLTTQVREKFAIPDGNWQIVINAPNGGVNGQVAFSDSKNATTKDADVASLYANVGEKESNLAEWGGCASRQDSSLADCRTTCSWFAVCSLMACSNIDRRGMAGLAADCYQTCDVNATLIVSKFQNMPCKEVAEAINNQSSFVALFKEVTSCTLDLAYDGRSPANGIEGLEFNAEGRLVSANKTTAGRRLLAEDALSHGRPGGFLAGLGSFTGGGIGSFATFPAESAALPYGAAAAAIHRDAVATLSSMTADAAGGRGGETGRRALAEVPPAPLPPPPPPPAQTEIFYWPGRPSNIWQSLGATDEQAMGVLEAATARALFTWTKEPCTSRFPINPYTNASRMVAFFCAYLGGPERLPTCNYTHPSTGEQLTDAIDLARAMQSYHARMNAGQDEERSWINIWVDSLSSVVSLATTTLQDINNYLHLLDSVIATGGPTKCKKVAVTLPWALYSHYNTTITVGDTVQWVWGDDEPHSINMLTDKGNGVNASLQGVGSGNLTVARTALCTPQNTAGLGITELPPFPCSLADPEVPQTANTFAYSWTPTQPGTYFYDDGVHGTLVTGEITVVPAGQLTGVVSESFTWPAPPEVFWASMGSTDQQRLDNLGTAMARALFTLVKDPCAARHPINPYKNATRLVAFMCAYLGGPATLPGCSYTDASTGVALTEPLDLARAMQAFHKRFKAGQDEEDAWVSILLQSIVSVVALPADTVLALSNYLRLLDQVLVTGGPSVCKEPSISLTWGQYSHYNTTITVGDTVEWVWDDDEPHSITDQKAGDSLLAGYAGTGSGNLTVSRVDTCTADNTAGLGIQQLPPAPCALAHSTEAFTYAWRFDRPGVYYYQDGTPGSTANGKITVLPAGRLASAQNEVYYWPAPPPEMWQTLGSSDFDRLQAVQITTSRALFTWPKEACTARFPIDPYKAAARFSAFFCAYLGGPPTLPGCNFTDRATGRQLTDPLELARAMQVAHASFASGKDEQTAFIQTFLDALVSVATVPADVFLEVKNYLHLLDAVIVTGGNTRCDSVDVTLPWKTGAKHNTTITAGDTIQWAWADDEAHSIRELKITNGPYANFQGVGSGRLIVSRNTRCNSLNSGGLNVTRLPPVPCALTSTEILGSGGQFSYSWTFDTPGTYYYECGRVATLASGQITVLPRAANDVVDATGFAGRPLVEQVECAPGCPLWHLRNGLCKADCNVDACAYDGGDCSCSNPASGATCACWPGQVRDPSGACCEAATLGTDLAYPFIVNEFAGSRSDVDALFKPNTNYTKTRSFALKNRMVIGMLLHQTRGLNERCADTRFKSIYPSCLSYDTSVLPFGVDPVFLTTSDLFDPSLKPADAYVAGELNAKDIPYGFFHEPLEGYKDGFPLIFDINLDNKGAVDRLQYLIDGFYIDNATESLLVQIITFNGDRQEFANTEVLCTFQRGGKLAIQWSINGIKVQLYRDPMDFFRAVFEIVVFAAIIYNIAGELHEAYLLYKETGRSLAYFESGWNIVDLLSLAILFACAVLWIRHLVEDTIPFDMEPRYDVYNLKAESRFWQLFDGGAGFRSAAEKYRQMHEMIAFRQLYKALNGVNIFLLMLRVLKVLDFQPRMGIITRTLSAAAPELLHFGLLMGIIFVTYSLMAHLVFGHIIDAYRTFAIALSTNFNLILGDTDVAADLLILQGWELWAGQIFYWTFIVFLIFILMNFLIAIVVDAFTEAKSSAEGAPTLPAEIADYVNDWLKSVRHGHINDATLLGQLHAWGARKLTSMKSEVGQAQKEEDQKAGVEVVLKLGPDGPTSIQVDSQTLQAVLERASRRNALGLKAVSTRRPVEPRLARETVLARFGEEAERKVPESQKDFAARNRKPKKLSAEELRLMMSDLKTSLTRIEQKLGMSDNTEPSADRIAASSSLRENRSSSTPSARY